MKMYVLLVVLLTREKLGDTLKIPKCCRDWEKFDSQFEKCVPFKKRFFAPKTLVPPMDEEVAYWIPPYLRFSPLSYWNDLDHFLRYDFTAVIPADNETVSKILKVDSKTRSFVRDVFEEDLTNYLFEKQKYCFEGSDNPLLPHVVKTVVKVLRVNKCCAKNAQLNRYLSRCEIRPEEGNKEGEQAKTNEEEVEYTDDTSWIPSAFAGKKFRPAYYNEGWADYYSEFSAFKIDDDEFRRNGTREENRFAGMSIPILSGDEEYKFHHYCFETVRAGPLAPKVLLYHPVTYNVRVVPRCCLPGEVLSESGFCVSEIEMPRNVSSLAKVVGQNGGILFEVYLFAQCMQNRYEAKAWEPSDKNLLSVKKSSVVFSPNWTFYCVDWQHTAEGPREVLGKCRLPANVKLYESVRPLGAVSAMFLLAAIGAALIRKQTRTSAHGWALASHALCLATVNILQVTWFFASDRNADCSLYEFPTYFFMVAGNTWLSAIAGNMLYGFRNPLRALASRGGSGSDWAVTCKRFAVMSLAAWGIPSGLTALSVTKHQENINTLNTLHPPTFLETRLCFTASILGFFSNPKFGRVEPNIYGSLFYYYIPIAVLVIGNTACVIYVACKIRTLNKDQTFLRADHKPESANTQSAMMYLKLLLIAGVLEWSSEIAALCIRLRGNDENFRRFDYAVQVAESTHYFTIAATILDFGRSAGVLWLCTGWHCQVADGWFFWWMPIWSRCLQMWQKPSIELNDKTSPNNRLTETTYL